MRRRFAQVDVFTDEAYLGNPVAVVLDSDGVTTDQMKSVARWMNLSETTFVLPPTVCDADYRVRIFTPSVELPFAGHPTLGTCHAWMSNSPVKDGDRVVQQCDAGLISIRRLSHGLAFSPPPLVRYGPVDDEVVTRVASMLNIDRGDILDSHWVDNGPGWLGLLLENAEDVLDLRPRAVDLCVGVIGPYPAGKDNAFEVRAFLPSRGSTVEDPVTGSLNASLAQWIISTGRADPPYAVSQGSAVGAGGRVHIDSDPDGTLWVGGGTTTAIAGEIEI